MKIKLSALIVDKHAFLDQLIKYSSRWSNLFYYLINVRKTKNKKPRLRKDQIKAPNSSCIQNYSSTFAKNAIHMVVFTIVQTSVINLKLCTPKRL